MNKKNGLKAKVDGREVDVEIIEGGSVQEETSEPRQFFSKWRSVAPFVVTGIVITGMIMLSLSIFIWALPVLIPLFLVLFAVRMLRRM